MIWKCKIADSKAELGVIVADATEINNQEMLAKHFVEELCDFINVVSPHAVDLLARKTFCK